MGERFGGTARGIISIQLIDITICSVYRELEIPALRKAEARQSSQMHSKPAQLIQELTSSCFEMRGSVTIPKGVFTHEQ
jgi:hypothetical protein